MSYWSVPPMWAGETVAILGCGPSRNLVCMERLRATGYRVIAINDSFRAAPWADMLYFCDQTWYASRQPEISRIWTGAPIVTLENTIHGVARLHNTEPLGFDPDPSCLRHGSNSGYQAIHLAAHLGAKRIVLFGFDMRVVGHQLHAEARPERQSEAVFQRTIEECMLPSFPTIVEPLAERGIEVLNASPGSALKCWPMIGVEEALNGCPRPLEVGRGVRQVRAG